MLIYYKPRNHSGVCCIYEKKNFFNWRALPANYCYNFTVWKK